jgi:hypothetical protein
MSVKSRDIHTKFETNVETKKYTLDFESKVTYQVQAGGSHHYEKIQTVLSQFLSESHKLQRVGLRHRAKLTNAIPEMTNRFQDGPRRHV